MLSDLGIKRTTNLRSARGLRARAGRLTIFRLAPEGSSIRRWGCLSRISGDGREGARSWLAGHASNLIGGKRRSYCGVHGTLAVNLNRFRTMAIARLASRAQFVTVYGAEVGDFAPGTAIMGEQNS